MRTSLNPSTVPHSPFYAQGVEVAPGGRTVYVSGQVGIGADGVPEQGIGAQARRAILVAGLADPALLVEIEAVAVSEQPRDR